MLRAVAGKFPTAAGRRALSMCETCRGKWINLDHVSMMEHSGSTVRLYEHRRADESVGLVHILDFDRQDKAASWVSTAGITDGSDWSQARAATHRVDHAMH